MLKIQNLEKSFGDKNVLNGLTLTVPEHSLFGFLGKNGAGKTTTMKAVLGLLKSDGGTIEVNGEKVYYGQTATNRYIGYLPDVPEFYSFMNAPEYLNFCGEISKMEKSLIKKRAAELLSLVGLEGEKHRIGGFSRGMKQRLGIAQALMSTPKLLICDEPTSALDPVGRREILQILLSLKEQTTVLFSTHILSDVESICTDVAFLDSGKVTVQGKLSEIKSLYGKDEYVLKTDSADAENALAKAFPELIVKSADTLTIRGDNSALYTVMQYITDNKLPILKIEKLEPTLESLFMEVVK